MIGFAKDAKAALRGMRYIAGDLGHASIDSGHLLLALVRTTPDLFRSHCEPAVLEEVVALLLQPGDPDGVGNGKELPFTSRMKTTLELAMREASGGNSEVEPEHLVIGILLEGEDRGAAALRERGIVSPDAWRSGSTG